MSNAIAAQGLSKRYVLRSGAAAGPYVTLRGMLSEEARRIAGRIGGADQAPAEDEL